MAFHLAQINIAKMHFSLQDPRMKDFVDNLAPVNSHAEASDGFIWRMTDETGNNTNTRGFADDILVNMSVWRDLKSLRQFMATAPHAPIMARRGEWFAPLQSPHAVLWWIPVAHTPTVAEAKERLDHLEIHGASAYAFTFAKSFGKPIT